MAVLLCVTRYGRDTHSITWFKSILRNLLRLYTYFFGTVMSNGVKCWGVLLQSFCFARCETEVDISVPGQD